MAGLTRDRLKQRVKVKRKGAIQPLHPLESEGADSPPPVEDAGQPATVEELLPGVAETGEHGTCWLMQPDAASVCDWSDAVLSTLRAVSADPPSELSATGDLAFLDIETAGLSGMPAFLVGVLRFTDSGLVITQMFARDYPEEAAVLHRTVEALAGSRYVLTYNGATFDMPYLRNRATYHAVGFDIDPEHVDLIKPARRRFRKTFPNCKLQTLERMLCGRDRGDDIPGSEIPRAYQDFVRTQDARTMATVIRHNIIDLLTLAEILPHCLTEDAG